MPTIMDRESGAIDGQASMTIASSASIAALSAALLDQVSDFPDDFAVGASPVSPTPPIGNPPNSFLARSG
jgi:hypothetical protein